MYFFIISWTSLLLYNTSLIMSKRVWLALLLLLAMVATDRVVCAPVQNDTNLHWICPEDISNAMLLSNATLDLINTTKIKEFSNCTYPPHRGRRGRISCHTSLNFKSSASYCCYSSKALNIILTKLPEKNEVTCECYYELDPVRENIKVCSLLMYTSSS